MKATQPTEAFASFLATFALFTEATRRVNALDADVNGEVQDIIEANTPAYIAALAAAKEAADALIEWGRAHPEWFNGKQSLTTPHGTLAKRATRSLEIENPAITLRLITAKYGEVATEYIHTEQSPDKEALEKLEDADLAALGVRRVKGEVITPKPLKVDMGKAVATEQGKATVAAK